MRSQMCRVRCRSDSRSQGRAVGYRCDDAVWCGVTGDGKTKLLHVGPVAGGFGVGSKGGFDELLQRGAEQRGQSP